MPLKARDSGGFGVDHLPTSDAKVSNKTDVSACCGTIIRACYCNRQGAVKSKVTLGTVPCVVGPRLRNCHSTKVREKNGPPGAFPEKPLGPLQAGGALFFYPGPWQQLGVQDLWVQTFVMGWLVGNYDSILKPRVGYSALKKHGIPLINCTQ